MISGAATVKRKKDVSIFDIISIYHSYCELLLKIFFDYAI